MKTYFASKPAYPLPEIQGSWAYIKYPCVAEVKLDGEFDYLVGDGKTAYLINTYGRVREDLPITQECAGFNGVLAGELYYNHGKSFFEEMLSHKFAPELKFYAFDILRYGDRDLTGEQLDFRRMTLNPLIVGEHLRLAEQVLCKDKPAVEAFYQKVIGAGYEGIVVKNLQSRFVNGTCQSWMKLKHTETLDVYAIGYKKGKAAIAIGYLPSSIGRGNRGVPLGAVGNAGKEFNATLDMVKAQAVIAEDSEYCYVEPRYCLEVTHLGVLKSGMLRNPVMKRLRQDKERRG